MKLELIAVQENNLPAVFHENAAAKYLGMNREHFRKNLLMTGIIPYTIHLNGKTRIFLRSDLDAYLDSLPRRRMDSRENPLIVLKGTK